MESRAKQRLTGAVILVALIVLLVPELLTGPRDARPPSGTDNEEGLRRYTIDLESQGTASAPERAPANEPAVALPTPQATSAPSALAEPGEAAAPAAANPEPVEPGVAVAPVESKPPPKPAPAAAPAAAAGNFVVQLGTFSKRDNADRLVRDMTAKGFAAFVVPTTSSGHALYRVRVGPVRDRPAAEALAAQLKRAGQSGSIVPIS